MISILSSLFDDKLANDDRSPIFSFSCWGSDWGLFLPKISFWIQILTGLVLTGLFSLAMCAITFYIIIPNRDSAKGGRGRGPSGTCTGMGKTTASLVAFGIVIPLMAMLPVVLLDALDVMNKTVRFCFGAIFPVCTFFRTSEALNGYSPRGVESSFQQYALYNLSILPMAYEECTDDSKKDDGDGSKKSTTHPDQIRVPLKATASSILENLAQFGKCAIVLGLYMSIFSPSNYEPYESSVNANEHGVKLNLMTVLDWNLFRNNCACTLFFQLALTTFTTALALIVQLVLGIRTESAMQNPVFTSTSISEFWGEKWNLIVHGVLKRGVFKPVYRMTSSKISSVLATFFFSGLFHEYLLLVTMMHVTQEVKPFMGLNTAFMMWNAGTLTLEFLLMRNVTIQKMKQKAFRPVLTAMVLCSAMPIAHWFMHPYSKTGFTNDFHVGFPMILKL